MKLTAIALEGEHPFRNREGKLNWLDQLSPVNMFVGPNNSGKSRLMRLLIAQHNPSIKAEFDPKVMQCETDRANAVHALKNIVAHYARLDGHYVDGNSLAKLPKLVPDRLRSNGVQSNRETAQQLLEEAKAIGTGDDLDLHRFNSQAKDALQTILSNTETAGKLLPDPNVPAVYVPVLRGLRHLDRDAKDIYQNATKRDYFRNTPANHFKNIQFHTGLDLYGRIRSMLLGDLAQRRKIDEYQQYLTKTFFSGQSVVLIPRESEGVLHIKIGDEKERPIYDLGDGLQNLVIITFSSFSNDRALLFVEEPELYLHPGLQRTLLSFFLDECKKRDQMVFLTTHSNHFLDLTFEHEGISVYSLHKTLPEGGDERVPEFRIEQVTHGDKNLLYGLGVRESSVYLVNATIWVEGITDRLYLQRFFELYQESLTADEPKFCLDTHYAFVEYGGSNITHLSWEGCDEDEISVKRVCARAFVVADTDDPETKKERHEKLKNELDDRYYRLQCREVENLIHPNTLKAVVAHYEKKTVGELPVLKHEDYVDKLLGEFIKEWLGNPQRSGGYAEASGTLKDKRRFCEKALEKLELTDPAKDLCEKMYAFIKGQNE